jgi:hypothetical protein
VSPKVTGKSLRTFVDPTFAANERGKRFTMQFVFRTVTEHARPLGSRSFVRFLPIGGAQDKGGERLNGAYE